MFLTVREAAALLRTTERQIYRWVDDEEIPFRRVRDRYRFNRTDLLEWATSRRLLISLEAFGAGLDPEDRAPSLAAALQRGGVHEALFASGWEAALRAAVGHTPLPSSADPELIIEVLLARGPAGSALIDDDIAIPFVRQPIVAAGTPAAVSVSHLDPPVVFGAPNAGLVGTLILIVSPTIRTHLQLSARLARALQDPGFRAALLRRAGTEKLAAEAARIEAAPSVPPPPPAEDRAQE
jgi:nitrogen PTS system EIIA component